MNRQKTTKQDAGVKSKHYNVLSAAVPPATLRVTLEPVLTKEVFRSQLADAGFAFDESLVVVLARDWETAAAQIFQQS